MSVSVLVSAAAAGCAGAATFNPYGLPDGQVANINRICGSVMGLEHGEEHYQNCVESLMASARGLDRGLQLSNARAACRRSEPGASPVALSECELQRADSQPIAAPTDGSEALDSPPAKSYAYASNGEVRRRERIACARLGLDPLAADFGACVAGLQASMFAADNPAN